MTERSEPAVHWEPPVEPVGPAPGIDFAPHGPRLAAGVLTVAVPILGMLAVIAVLVVFVMYFPYSWQKSGQTPGMKLLGIKVVRDTDGGSLTWGGALVRMIGFWVSGAVFYLGYIWVFIDKRRRGWHDLMASTVVVKV